MKRITLLIFSCLYILNAGAQANFYSSVKIEFEKVTVVPALIKEMSPEWYDMIKDHLPKSTTTYYDFIGDSTHAIYKPGKETEADLRGGFFDMNQKNFIYSDFQNNKTIAQKPVFEVTFLVNDTMQKIKWKLTADIRTIAGFDCRKAVGILDDSIAVFAFYTDQIMIPGGPESIHGLPGMILGVGIPRLHSTWFATQVQVNNINLSPVVPASKGKKVDRATMMKQLEPLLKQWGPYGSKMSINFAI